jgi:hypothetical protein
MAYTIQAVIKGCSSRKSRVTFAGWQLLAVLQVEFADGHQRPALELRQRHPPLGRQLHAQTHIMPQNPSTRIDRTKGEGEEPERWRHGRKNSRGRG